MLIQSFLKTVKSLSSTQFLSTIFLCGVLTLLLYVSYGVGLFYLLSNLDIDTGFALLNQGFSALGGLLGVILAWFMLPVMVPLVAGLLQERVVNQIEAREYPESISQNQFSFLGELIQDIRFIAWMLLLNILCFPLYFVPVVNLFIYYLLNAHLLGREFFEAVAAMSLGKKQAKLLRKNHKMKVFLSGGLLLGVANVPVLNLIAPLISVGFMVHLTKAISNKSTESLQES